MMTSSRPTARNRTGRRRRTFVLRALSRPSRQRATSPPSEMYFVLVRARNALLANAERGPDGPQAQGSLPLWGQVPTAQAPPTRVGARLVFRQDDLRHYRRYGARRGGSWRRHEPGSQKRPLGSVQHGGRLPCRAPRPSSDAPTFASGSATSSPLTASASRSPPATAWIRTRPAPRPTSDTCRRTSRSTPT